MMFSSNKKYFIDLTLGGCGHTVHLLETNQIVLSLGWIKTKMH